MNKTKTKQKLVTQILDHETGEHAYDLVFPHKTQFSAPWAILWLHDHLAKIATSDLSLTEIRVFLILLSYMDFQNIVTLRQKNISLYLNISPAAVSRAIKQLRAKQILIKYHDVDMLNPALGWRGNGKKGEKLRLEYQGQILHW